MTAERSTTIATLNDSFRAACGMPAAPLVPGRYVMTAGVAALSPRFQLAALGQVRSFTDFSEDNDPYGEHDFGNFAIEEAAERFFWKIDYFADAAMTAGAQDPANVNASYRVLTLMLASEY